MIKLDHVFIVYGTMYFPSFNEIYKVFNVCVLPCVCVHVGKCKSVSFLMYCILYTFDELGKK